MGSNFNFSDFGIDPQQQVNNRPPGNGGPLTSVYSLTFDELQNALGGSGKDFGSMNMEELVKSIWSAEENQTMASAGGAIGQEGNSGGGGGGGNYLQRQGSLTLPRTLSHKTVEEVWKNIANDSGVGKDGGVGGGNSGVPQRQQTLGGMTLEEFLVRAGVVREDVPQCNVKPGNGVLFGGLTQGGGNNNDSALGMGFQQMGKGGNMMGLRNFGGESNIPIQTSNLPLTVNGVRSNQRSVTQPHHHHQQILPKQPAVTFASQLPSPTRAQLCSPGIRGGIMGITDQVMNNNLIPVALQGGGMGMVGLGGGAIGVGTGSPANPVSSDGIRSNGDNSSVSPVPYVFNSGIRGRKCGGAVEKVIERRQRRMIKNRESAARSRARKQAYTMELEAEVAKLKEENEELRKKQAEIMEARKNQVMEMINMERGAKKRCLRRTQTGPW